MKVLCLISGGKDSIYNIHKCIQYGHTPVALANLYPADKQLDELDSYCFQTVGFQLIHDISLCMNLPLYQCHIYGNTSINQSLHYTTIDYRDEIEQLYRLIKYVCTLHTDIQAISCGAILSNYQRLRMENICQRLSLISLTYLWQYNQSVLLSSMVADNINAILIKTASSGLSADKHCNKSIDELQSYLQCTHDTHGINVCGEGGEYESLVLDCKLYTEYSITIDEYDIIHESIDPISGDINGFMKIYSWYLQSKHDHTQIIHRHIDDIQFNPIEFNDVNIQTTTNHETVQQNPTDAKLYSPSSNVSINQYSSTDYMFITAATTSPTKKSSLQQQMYDIFDQLTTVLQNNQTSVNDIYYIHVLINDIDSFNEMNSIYSTYFSSINPASRACLQLKLSHNSLIQIECCIHRTVTKQVLHVQSISEWAAACIGPYSQSNTIDNIVYIAGQIGLYPPTMALNHDAVQQTIQCINNCNAVLNCTKSSTSHIISPVIYISETVTDNDYSSITDTISTSLMNNKQQLIYITVPAMPRNAAVEIQLVAVESHLHAPIYQLNTINVSDYTISLQYTYATKHYCSIWCTITINDKISILSNITGHIVKLIRDYVQSIKLSVNNLTTSRIFCIDTADIDNINNDICCTWNQLYNTTIHCTPYRVNRINNDSHCIAAIHFMFCTRLTDDSDSETD